MLRIVALGLCLCALVTPALAETCRGYPMPPHFDAPPVAYTRWIVAPEVIYKFCGRGKQQYPSAACAYQSADGAWQILIKNTMPAEDLDCITKYEEAHLPPNYWADPNVELPATIGWMNADKERLQSELPLGRTPDARNVPLR